MLSRKHKAKLICIPITESDELTIGEALNLTPAESKLWKEAIELELQTIREKRTWSKVKENNLKNIKALPFHIILKIKCSKHGQPKGFKARFVGGGHKKVFKRDYNKTYAPVVDFATCLMILIIAFFLDWDKRQVDVKAAFLNGDIDRLLHVRYTANLPWYNQKWICPAQNSILPKASATTGGS